MTLSQVKLSKIEWGGIEVPETINELKIQKMIVSGYRNPNIKCKVVPSLMCVLKLENNSNNDHHVYVEFLEENIEKLCIKYKISYQKVKKMQFNLKKSDEIRLSTMSKKIHDKKVLEFDLIKIIGKLFSYKRKQNKNWLKMYYNLYYICTHQDKFNRNLKKFVQRIISEELENVCMTDLLKSAHTIFENNEYITSYTDYQLYEHQKKLFSVCKDKNPKFIQYIAPTGTGKTLSPLGLSEGHRIIFVCAARHIGLSLAKSAISNGKKVAFALGCDCSEDVRLHYFAAKDYVINKKTGGIGKVDNTVGDNVEIMISDIKSYLPAMYYMLAFNDAKDIILYWDEPTITMDYLEHEYHEVISNNWRNNAIPNVVFASATLPHISEMQDTVCDFRSKFDEAYIHTIVSHEYCKSISLVEKDGHIAMPHYISDDYEVVSLIVKECFDNTTVLRYLDLSEIVGFIETIFNSEDVPLTKARYDIENYFPTIDKITSNNIKEYYLHLLGNIDPERWNGIYELLNSKRKKVYGSNIHFMTSDANTLTGGPTIFLSNDVRKIARFCMQEARIPTTVINDISKSIQFNNKIKATILELQKKYEEGTMNMKERKLRDIRVDPELKNVIRSIENLNSSFRNIQLSPIFIPNSQQHLQRYCENFNNKGSSPFTSNISESVVNRIMKVEIEDLYKVLLLMGIGVFQENLPSEYNNIIKEQAQEKKLYMIIASSDYIYGTNYQFSHGYIGNDLKNMTRDKCIQAMGRIGRSNTNTHHSIRFRDNALIHQLFLNNGNKLEIINMSRIFNSYE